ncbi:putative transposase [Pseudomonas amygdali pv. ulmi]|uniref:Putative transposase n=1 Tax=Pseudomonas amygdali pv. ulmi TaxID=251720 RepID=A0A3M4SVD8_PSEA0|nr:putative transposase [Pseudomonas amygdali pv. ulmi]
MQHLKIHGKGGKVRYLPVTTCNRNGPDLQSSRFSTGIDCVYPSQQTGIICE